MKPYDYFGDREKRQAKQDRWVQRDQQKRDFREFKDILKRY